MFQKIGTPSHTELCVCVCGCVGGCVGVGVACIFLRLKVHIHAGQDKSGELK